MNSDSKAWWISVQLTFVLVAFWFNTQNGHHHDYDDNWCCSQGHQEPGLPIERLGLQVTIFQVSFWRGLNLEKNINC